MIYVSDQGIEIRGPYEVTYREMVRILTAYRNHLKKTKNNPMITDMFVNRMISETMTEKS